MNNIILLYVWLFAQTIGSSLPDSFRNNEIYHCARYAIVVDFTDVLSVAPVTPPNIVTHKLFIQYGSGIVIEVIDPGEEVEFLPVVVAKWDYLQDSVVFTTYLKHVSKYYSSKEALTFSPHQHKGKVMNECTPSDANQWCDSLRFTSLVNGGEYVIHFKDSLPNIPSSDLFYPDIAWLPDRITPLNTHRPSWILENVYVGQEVMDSILASYSYVGFEQITEAEIRSAQYMFPIEDIKSMMPPREE